MAHNEAANEKLSKEKSTHIAEIGDQPGVEQATERDLNLSAFMEDYLTIIVHDSSEEGAPFCMPNCNGLNQPIPRGRQVKVKRKYVEILARCRRTTYEQQVHDPSRPENIQMVPKTSLIFPFAVIHDPHKYGKEWLDQILAQPN